VSERNPYVVDGRIKKNCSRREKKYRFLTFMMFDKAFVSELEDDEHCG
jgi:hypothetical protein